MTKNADTSKVLLRSATLEVLRQWLEQVQLLTEHGAEYNGHYFERGMRNVRAHAETLDRYIGGFRDCHMREKGCEPHAGFREQQSPKERHNELVSEG